MLEFMVSKSSGSKFGDDVLSWLMQYDDFRLIMSQCLNNFNEMVFEIPKVLNQCPNLKQ